MYISTASIITLACLLWEVSAKCGQGTFNGNGEYKRVSNCVLKQNNVYFCGDSGTTVVHKQSQLMLRAGKVDSTVLVGCANFSGYLYHCSAGEEARFREPNCKGAVWQVENVKEL
ncbi:uncharacterized protein CTRU02_206788 [Colletotrichum truncatum]|uniref:Uncharacterized protein n=1 Tax=Colletotrichum truncatum TaxID=5467 RepID=A0ACC3YZ07_COLTU|nr:uncharacterized protein CTRU02_14771 [Colletotrichum truncatum]KAF6781779.1 hypothetical protein CTRU02_14771 [Colletotrichum truncatum]